jgi:amidase
VEEGQPRFDFPRMVAAMKTLLRVHLALGVRDLAGEAGLEAKADQVERAHLDLARQWLQIAAPDFLASLEQLGQVARHAAQFWTDYDMWLTPTLAQPPLEHGTIFADDENSARYIESYFAFVPFTPLANVTGNPAMTVPLHWNDANLPVGTHFTAGFGREDHLFNLAGQLESARPWKSKIPPISAARNDRTPA